MAYFSSALVGSQAETRLNERVPKLLYFVLTAALLFVSFACIGYAAEKSRALIHAPHLIQAGREAQLVGILKANYRCAFLECIGIFTLGFINLVTLCGNGLQFGMFLRACDPGVFPRWIAPHVILELMSVVLVSGASLWFTWILLFSMLGRIRITRRVWVTLLRAEAAGWLGITLAAVVEVYLTPLIATHLG